MYTSWLAQFCLNFLPQGVLQHRVKVYSYSLAHMVAHNGGQMGNNSGYPLMTPDPFVCASSAHLQGRCSVQTKMRINYRADTWNKACRWSSAKGHPLFSPCEVLPYLPAQGWVFLKLFCSQDVSMDHVFHIGEIHQVLSIPAQTKGRRLAQRWVRLKVCLWHKGRTFTQDIFVPSLLLCSLVLQFQAIPCQRDDIATCYFGDRKGCYCLSSCQDPQCCHSCNNTILKSHKLPSSQVLQIPQVSESGERSTEAEQTETEW